MIRRNFISNIALTIPAGLLLPDMLFASESEKENKNAVKKAMIVIDAEKLGTEQLDRITRKGIEIISLPSSSIGHIRCFTNRFEVESKDGAVYQTGKIITGSSIKFQPGLSAASISYSGTRKLKFEYSGSKKVKRPAIVTSPSKLIDADYFAKLEKKHPTAVVVVL